MTWFGESRREAEQAGCGQLAERHVVAGTIPSHRRASLRLVA
jgi:hypothetical protein